MKKLYILLSFTLFCLPAIAVTLTEDFENGAFKTSYDINPVGNGAEDNVTLSSGSWRCYNGLRGNTAGSDRFNGT